MEVLVGRNKGGLSFHLYSPIQFFQGPQACVCVALVPGPSSAHSHLSSSHSAHRDHPAGCTQRGREPRGKDFWALGTSAC